MNILLTGASGFIGQHLVRKLEYLGHSCICLSRHQVKNKTNSRVKWYKVDSEFRNIESVICEQDIDGVYHISGATRFDPSTGPTQLLMANTSSTLNLLEFAKSRCVDWFIYASTGSVYGENQREDETLAAKPTSIYGASKLAGEQMLWAYQKELRCVATRIYFPYGPGQPKNQLIANLIHRVASNQEITLKPSPNGFLLSPTFIDDLVDILYHLAISDKPTGPINVATSDNISLRDLCMQIGDKLQIAPKFHVDQTSHIRNFSPALEELKRIYDISLMTKLSDGLNSTINDIITS